MNTKDKLAALQTQAMNATGAAQGFAISGNWAGVDLCARQLKEIAECGLLLTRPQHTPAWLDEKPMVEALGCTVLEER
jgi:hypothetical protein